MKPAAGETPVVLSRAAPEFVPYSMVQWSPKGDWIAYPSAEGISLLSPDGGTVRKLTARKLLAFDFSKDGAQVYGIFRNTTGEGAQWQLYSIDVKTGAEKMLAPVDLPASTDSIAGFSMHPDGKRFLTSIAKWPFDIWMLEGFDQRR
jgi:dipeptidyl aminopeptidase/acylaminoacyl peptidase